MNSERRRDTTEDATAMPAAEIERLLGLLTATGKLHPDLVRVLGDPDAEGVIEGIFADEIHDQRS